MTVEDAVSTRAQVRFDWFVVRRASFVDPFPQSAPSQKTLPRLQVVAEMQWAEATDQLSARVMLSLKFESDQIEEPVVDVAIEGLFSISDHSQLSQFQDFLKYKRAAMVLFPFAREVIHSLTRNCASGPVLVPLIDMGSLGWRTQQE